MIVLVLKDVEKIILLVLVFLYKSMIFKLGSYWMIYFFFFELLNLKSNNFFLMLVYKNEKNLLK